MIEEAISGEELRCTNLETSHVPMWEVVREAARRVTGPVASATGMFTGSGLERDEAEAPNSETKSDESRSPKIAEKVRFWEEQDRINKELIPRILKQHELFTQHVERHQDASAVIAALEARLLKQHELLTQHVERHQDASAVIAALETRLIKREKRVLVLVVAALVVAVAGVVLSLVP